MGIGSWALVLGSHAAIYGSALLLPYDLHDFVPDRYCVGLICSFYALQLALAAYAPGIVVTNGKLPYLCNAYASLVITMTIVGVLHVSGVFDLSSLVELYPQLLTCSVFLSNGLAVAVFCFRNAFEAGLAAPMSSWDSNTFVMGANLHPRLGNVDIKMLAEVHNSDPSACDPLGCY